MRLRIAEFHSCDHHLRDKSTVMPFESFDAPRRRTSQVLRALNVAAVASPCHPKSLHQMTERLCLSQPFSSLIPRVADLRRSVLEGALPRLLPSLQPVVEHQPELRLLPCSPPTLRLLSRIPRRQRRVRTTMSKVQRKLGWMPRCTRGCTWSAPPTSPLAWCCRVKSSLRRIACLHQPLPRRSWPMSRAPRELKTPRLFPGRR